MKMEDLLSLNKAGTSSKPTTKSKSTFYSELSFEDDFVNSSSSSNNTKPYEPAFFSPPPNKAPQHPTFSSPLHSSPASATAPSQSLSPNLSNAHASPLMCYVVRLKHGDELRKTLLAFVQKHGLKAAFVMTCVGSAVSAKLRTANASPNCEANYMLDIVNPTEIISLAGTLSGGGHLHVGLSDALGKMSGGHLLELIIDTTAEVVIGDCSALAFSRNFDQSTGFNELSVSVR